MEIECKGERYLVQSSSGSKKWEVDLKKNSCTCPHFLFRLRKTGGDCKHLQAVKAHVTGSGADKFDDIIGYVKDNVFVDSVELIEMFGEENVRRLIDMGELLESKGNISLL